MNLYCNVCTLFVILSIVILPEHSVLGDCGIKVKSPLAACVYSANGKCPHGMLRLDTDKKFYVDEYGNQDLYHKACGSTRYSFDAKGKKTEIVDPRACCLLNSRVDIKVNKSPCTGGACSKIFKN